MKSKGLILLSSIAIIAASAVANLFRKRENQATPTSNVPSNNTESSGSSSAHEDSVAATAGAYEVFLSFCGEDTRKGFTDFLYTYLVNASIRTFRDDNDLRVGEEIGPELLKAINESKISIPVLSKNYASSKWCFRELAEMVDCHKNGGLMIYPIFYDVDPSDVRNQTGSYGKSFRQHEKKFDAITVQSWREALRMVGGLKGLELKKETNGREGELVKIVVEKVLVELKKNHTHLPENLVGIDKHVDNMNGLLKVDSEGVRIVVIHGMGGLGKTSIAKVTYNQLCERFESHCFLENVRENSKHRDGILDLQNQLISKIQNNRVQKFSDVYEGRSRIKDTICWRNVFIVLDDVDEISQVNMLIGNHGWFGAHSRIIITTRDIDVLCAIEMACRIEGLHVVCTSYNPKYMGDCDSLQLFSKYAFMRDSPMEGYEHLSKEVVSIAAGLPLVLVVLGSTFFVLKGKDLWEEKLKKLRVIPHKEVLETLRFSFEALEYEQKQIFLDIACFFIRSEVTIPSYMWDACGFHPREGISVLISKSLITIGDDNKFIMHDQLRDLGRQIVHEEGLIELGKQSRLWCKVKAMQILEISQGISSVAVLCLPYEPSEGPVLASSFHGVPNLRYLHMGGQDLDGDFKHSFPNLRWLQWMSSGKFSPTNLQMKNLVVLDLSFSKVTKDWDGLSPLKMGKKLKVLDLTECSDIRVLPHLSMFASLEILRLDGCRSLCRLDGLEELKSLKYLYASRCYNLETLPCLWNLTNLVELYLRGCEMLVEIQGMEKLESLQVLIITDCESLERLPDFSNLKKLKTFKLDGCWKLIEIEGLEKLESFQVLDVSGCKSLERLKCSNSKELKTFVANGCSKLIEIVGMHKLNSIVCLDLRGCSSLKGVLDISNLNNLKALHAPTLEVTNFSNLKKLEKLEITFSGNLIEFQGLHGDELMIMLEVYGGSMKRLPELSCLKRLRNLVIRKCDEIQDLGGLDSLEDLIICNCEKLIEIQGLDRLESLKRFSIVDCPSLERLPDLPKFGMLKEIEVKYCEFSKLIVFSSSLIYVLRDRGGLLRLDASLCSNLETLPSLSNLTNLVDLNLQLCSKLVEIQGLEKLESLQVLNITYCESLERLPNISNLKKLKTFQADGCWKLIEIEGLEKLESLQHLAISYCSSLERLPKFSNLKRLKTFEARECWKLIEIEGLEKLESLQNLDTSDCKSLERLSDFSNLKKLKTFQARSCSKLIEIEGLEKLESLQDLYIDYCTFLERLPNFSNLKRLKTFEARECWKLIEIEGLEKLESLQDLDISDCKSLERLPDFSNLKKLKQFQAHGCSKLIEIEGLEKLDSLEHLDLRGCSSLKGFLDLSNLNNLQALHAPTLEVTNFSNLKKLEKLEITFSGNLIDFQGLDIDELRITLEVYGGSMKRLPELSCLKRLRNLAINKCDEIQDLSGLNSLETLIIRNGEKLIEIQGLDRLESLKCLSIVNCSSLERLPNLPKFGTLNKIEVKYCDKLDVVEGVGVIESLESLEISNCYKIREIPNLRSLKNLKTLRINSLEELTMIHGLEELKALESLNIVRCNSIEALPDFSNLEKLTELYVDALNMVGDDEMDVPLTWLGNIGDLVRERGETSHSLIEMKEDVPQTWLGLARKSEGVPNLPSDQI